VRQRGTRIRLSDLDARALVTARDGPRVGVIVPKYKHNAVDRNRLKRKLRELARLRLLPALRAGATGHAGTLSGERVYADIVLRALPGAYFVTRDALAAQLERVVHALHRPPWTRGEIREAGDASTDCGGAS